MKKLYPDFDNPEKSEIKDDPLADDLIKTDEWDHVRYLIKKKLEDCEYEGASEYYFAYGIPFLGMYKTSIEEKLIGAGFEKKLIKDDKEFRKITQIINFAQGRLTNNRWDLNPPYGYPSVTYKVSDGGYSISIRPDIEAALLSLQSIKQLKEVLFKDGTVNLEALKAYLHTFELSINILRSGLLPKLSLTGEKVTNAGTSGGEKSGEIRREKSNSIKNLWQAEADKIWKRHPTWKNKAIAEQIVKNKKNSGRTADYIRKKIKKPTL